MGNAPLKFHHHIRSTVAKAAGVSNNLLKSTLCRSPNFMLKLLITHIRPILEFASCVWNSGFITDLSLLESVQRRWTKKISGLVDMSYEQRLKSLDLFSVKGRLLRADLIKCWKIFHNMSPISPSDLFLPTPITTTRGHCYKLYVTQCSCDARRRFFSVRVVQVWNSLPADVVMSPSINLFKKGLSAHLGDILYTFND